MKLLINVGTPIDVGSPLNARGYMPFVQKMLGLQQTPREYL